MNNLAYTNPDYSDSRELTIVKDASDYYRPAVLLPIEVKERVQQRAKELGISVSSYIVNLIQADIGDFDKQEYGTPGEGRRTPKK